MKVYNIYIHDKEDILYLQIKYKTNGNICQEFIKKLKIYSSTFLMFVNPISNVS